MKSYTVQSLECSSSEQLLEYLISFIWKGECGCKQGMVDMSAIILMNGNSEEDYMSKSRNDD